MVADKAKSEVKEHYHFWRYDIGTRITTSIDVAKSSSEFYYPTGSRFVLDEVFRDGQYLEFLEEIDKELDQSKGLIRVFDLGASFGVFPLLLQDKLDYEFYFHLFEPHPENLKYLRKSITHNDISNYREWSRAVSDKEKSVELMFSNSLTGPTIQKDEYMAEKAENNISVETFVFDNHSFDSVDLVKLDIEGAEEAALKGMQDTIREHKPVILSSFEHRTNSLSEIKDLIDVDGSYEFKISENTEFVLGVPK